MARFAQMMFCCLLMGGSASEPYAVVDQDCRDAEMCGVHVGDSDVGGCYEVVDHEAAGIKNQSDMDEWFRCCMVGKSAVVKALMPHPTVTKADSCWQRGFRALDHMPDGTKFSSVPDFCYAADQAKATGSLVGFYANGNDKFFNATVKAGKFNPPVDCPKWKELVDANTGSCSRFNCYRKSANIESVAPPCHEVYMKSCSEEHAQKRCDDMADPKPGDCKSSGYSICFKVDEDELWSQHDNCKEVYEEYCKQGHTCSNNGCGGKTATCPINVVV